MTPRPRTFTAIAADVLAADRLALDHALDVAREVAAQTSAAQCGCQVFAIAAMAFADDQPQWRGLLALSTRARATCSQQHDTDAADLAAERTPSQ